MKLSKGKRMEVMIGENPTNVKPGWVDKGEAKPYVENAK